MEKASPSAFDEIATVFADYGQSIRGFVRYKLTRRNLEPFVRRRKHLKVLDVGGGSGPDAAWLASHGHEVTMLEPSKRQREYAERRFNFFLGERARNRITLLAATLEELPVRHKYDLALVHGVAMYQDDPVAFVKTVVGRLRKGGIISLVENGYYGAENRAIRNRDFQQLRSLQKTQRSINHLGQEVWSFRPEELLSLLRAESVEVLEWSGIRLITDELSAAAGDFTKRQLTDILDTESAHGRHPAMRAQGQLLHFIGRKQT